MTIDNFKDHHKGKINISLIPNGVSKNVQGDIICQFSLLIGLNIGEETYDFDVDNASDFMESFAEKINTSIEKFKIKIHNSNPEISYVFGKRKIFDAIHKNRWRKLLSPYEFFMHRGTNSFAKNIEEKVAKAIPLFQNNDLGSDEPAKSFYSTVDSILNKSNYRDSIDLKILEREKKYDDIGNQGQANSITYAKFRTENIVKSKKKRDLLLLVNSIYQHPTMSRYYGLIYNFEIDRTTEGGKTFVNEYFREEAAGKGRELKLNLEVEESVSEFFQADKCNTDPKIKHQVDLYTSVRDISGTKKYYHGIKDFGCILNSEFDYSLLSVSPDRTIQNEKLTADTTAEILREGKRLIEAADIKRKVTEGIYLIKKPGANNTPVSNCNLGILGYAVAALVTNKNKSTLSSLCKRQAIYNPIGFGSNLSEYEEGWVHLNLVLDAGANSFSTQTVFHWTGHNLCVPKLGERKDQKLTIQEREHSGGFVGIFEADEEKALLDNGYTVKYKLVPESDIQLIEKKEYKFLLRKVLVNGYTLPLKSENNFELSLQDLARSDNQENKSYFFGVQKFPKDTDPDPFYFSLSEDPVSSPTLVGNKIYEAPGQKTSESNTHLVIFNNDESEKRFVFPPIIDLQFAQYLGLLSKEELQPANVLDYQVKGRKITKRVGEKIPPPTSDDDISYLPDTRGKCLVITPANWFTRWLLLKENKSLELNQDNFFDYSSPDKNFPNLHAGNIKLKATDTFNWAMSKNQLQVEITEGLQLKFYIQLHENATAALELMQKNTLYSNFINANKDRFLSSQRNLPQYSKGQFQLTRARLKPQKPVITLLNTGVSRPTQLTDNNKVLYSFKIENPFPYLQTVKQLQLVTTSFILNDDRISTPTKEQIDNGLDEWKKRNKNKDFNLLNNELPKEIFEQKIIQTETEVYKNNFGFSIKLNESKLMSLKLKKDDEIVHLNAGNNFDIFLRYDTGVKCILYYNNNALTFVKEIDVTKLTTILIGFNLAPDHSSLCFNISVKSDKDTETKILFDKLIPYADLSENNLSLLPKIEQLLLLVDEPGNKEMIFNFEHNNEFFVYRPELSAGMIKKSITVQAVSRFLGYYPRAKPDDYVSDESDSKNLFYLDAGGNRHEAIPNNAKPEVPNFQMQPLLLHDTEEENNAIKSKRSMQIMFEIDRPLRTDETFALVISENNLITPSTCAIGRDLTTYNVNNFADTLNPEGFLLDKFIVNNGGLKYVTKYFNGLTIPLRTRTTVPFTILSLVPYYEKTKGKWVVVLALNQAMLGMNNLNAYNPFLKIVATSYIENSTTGNSISEFSKPKYINIISERFITVTKVNDKQDYWDIQISNISQVKRDNQNRQRSVFVAFLREKSTYGISGDLAESTDITGKKSVFHIFEKDKLSIFRQKRKVLCVYEFETFDNSVTDLADVKWLQEETYRMIYAEEF